MHRFFSTSPLKPEIKLVSGNQFHQILRVFRSKIGDSIIFFEIGGNDIVYGITCINKKEVILKQKNVIKKILKKENEIKLFQAYPNKISTMEFIVQKMVELGISEILFFPSERSQIKNIPAPKKSRLEAIALESLEQSWGNIPIKISYSTENIPELWGWDDLLHIAWTIGEKQKLDITDWNGALWFWVWPEWGWSEEEKNFFLKNNVKLWSFNANILRLETASIVGIWLLKYLSQIGK